MQTGLPEPDEIIITEDGYFILDIHGLEIELNAEQIGSKIWCG